MRLDESQTAAIKAATSSRFRIVNGGAGAGKTTIIRKITEKLEERGENVELCAFAGKAAARVREATEHEAQTIHRLLGYQGDIGFTTRSLSGRTVIVDEASMIPASLLYEIVKRNPDRLILVGDEAQLPPVGSGQPFHDTIRFRPDCVSTLTTCYRNREAIFSSAYRIRNGEVPQMETRSDNEHFVFENVSTPRLVQTRILDMVKRGDIDFTQDIILCCRNGENEGAEATVGGMNAAIKNIVNPNEDGSAKVASCDRVINTKNCPTLDVWNGTTGTVDCFDVARAMYVTLDYPAIDAKRSTYNHDAYTNSVMIDKADVKNWQLAYALTTHKSQGSQYRKVVFVCLERDIFSGLLDRSMLYTAVTRAKNECIVIGEYSAFRRAISLVPNKKTVLQTLFNGVS